MHKLLLTKSRCKFLLLVSKYLQYCIKMILLLGSTDHKPKELLPVTGYTFEEQVTSFIDDIFPSTGLEVISWTRVPYLCEGDLWQSYYWLDDAVFLLKIKEF